MAVHANRKTSAHSQHDILALRPIDPVTESQSALALRVELETPCLHPALTIDIALVGGIVSGKRHDIDLLVQWLRQAFQHDDINRNAMMVHDQRTPVVGVRPRL